MAYFQNPFDNDFIGHLLLDDRQYVLDFKVPANINKSTYMFAWADPPYNTVGNTTLTINYSVDGVNFYPLACSLTSGSARTADQIAADLNAITNFTSLFEAKVVLDHKLNVNRLMLQARLQREKFRAYISNTSAETVLRFNKKAGVAEMPSYFARHTITNFRDKGPNATNEYPDSQNCLIQLSQPTDDYYITAAGLSTTPQADYQLLRGRSQSFMFVKNTVDGSNRITVKIEYPAGAKVGDLARKTTYSYTSANTNPDQVTTIPYVLTSGDLVTP